MVAKTSLQSGPSLSFCLHMLPFAYSSLAALASLHFLKAFWHTTDSDSLYGLFCLPRMVCPQTSVWFTSLFPSELSQMLLSECDFFLAMVAKFAASPSDTLTFFPPALLSFPHSTYHHQPYDIFYLYLLPFSLEYRLLKRSSHTYFVHWCISST